MSSILSLAGKELIFFIPACMVLCFRSVNKSVDNPLTF